MKELPILMSAPMVRAILEGRKTQTRRVVKEYIPPNISDSFPHVQVKDGVLTFHAGEDFFPSWGKHIQCPYGHPGDRLWVRETWWNVPEPSLKQLREGGDAWPKPKGPQDERVDYAAYDADREGLREWRWKLRPSIFMPRWASRITLEITDVRVQRLQEISEEDAIAEGIRAYEPPPSPHCGDPRHNFGNLWDSINAKTHPWASNPWVWALKFRRVAEKESE